MEKKKKNKRDTSRSMWERVPYDGTRDKQEYKKKKRKKKKAVSLDQVELDTVEAV